MKIRLFIMADQTSKKINKEYYFNHFYARYLVWVLSIAPNTIPPPRQPPETPERLLKARQRNPG